MSSGKKVDDLQMMYTKCIFMCVFVCVCLNKYTDLRTPCLHLLAPWIYTQFCIVYNAHLPWSNLRDACKTNEITKYIKPISQQLLLSAAEPVTWLMNTSGRAMGREPTPWRLLGTAISIPLGSGLTRKPKGRLHVVSHRSWSSWKITLSTCSWLHRY